MRRAYAAPFELTPGRTAYLLVDDSSRAPRRVNEVSDWLVERAATTESHHTLRSMAESVAQWWGWCSHKGINPLATDAVRFASFVTDLSSVPKGYDAWSEVRVMPDDPRRRKPGTIKVRVAHIKTFYKWALANGRVSVPTGLAISAFKAPAAATSMRADRLHPDHVGRLMGLDMKPRDRFGIELLYGCGLRDGEALSLRIDDLCLDADVAAAWGCYVTGPHLHVRPRHNPNGARSKSKRERIVPVPQRVRRAYREWQAWAFDHLPEAADSPYLVLSTRGSTKGEPFSMSGFQGMWGRRVTEAGIGHATPHLLRHTYASELMDAGVDTFVVQELLGHASPKSTQVYTHPHHDTLVAAVEQLADWRHEKIGLSR